MANTWELICHHTYAGTPGVVYDRSPMRSSHGTAWNLADGDFLADGAAPGSGSVQFHRQDGFIHIPCTAPAWQSVVGIRCEVTLRREHVPQSFILDSNAFQLYVRSGALNGWFSSSPTQYAQINSAWDPAGSQPYVLPAGKWVTLGFVHDGFGTMELSADGKTIARKQGAYHPVNAPGARGVGIGNALAGGATLKGEIDELKIWRLNPHKMDEEFLDRPMDPETAECWRRFRRELGEWLARHPDCARQLDMEVAAALEAITRRAQSAAPRHQKRLADLRAKYRQLWQQGKVGSTQMAEVFEELVKLLRTIGIDFKFDPALLELLNSGCLKRLLAELKPMDCDRQAAKLVRSLATNLRLNRKTTA